MANKGFLNFFNLFRKKPGGEQQAPKKPGRREEDKPKTVDDAQAADDFFRNLPEREWVHFSSSNLHSAAFYSHGASGTLRVRFKDKGGAITTTAEYYGVDVHDWIELCRAGPQGTAHSHGVVFYHTIRSRYPFSYV